MTEQVAIQELEPPQWKAMYQSKILKLREVIQEIEVLDTNTPLSVGSVGGVNLSIAKTAIDKLVGTVLTNLENFDHIL
jgi:hypothetical protein